MQLQDYTAITSAHRHIFLSPNFGDVVLSCGGTLGVQVASGLRPLIITVFAAQPLYSTDLSQEGEARIQRAGCTSIEDYWNKLREADMQVMDALNVDYLYLSYQSFLFQNDAKSAVDQTTTVIQADRDIASLLVSLRARLPDSVWYAPLGLERSSEYQIVSSASDRLVQQGAVVNLYEEFPQIVLHPESLQERLQEFDNALDAHFVEMSEFLSLRQESAASYVRYGQSVPSQNKINALIEHYTSSIRPVETVRLERYWYMA